MKVVYSILGSILGAVLVWMSITGFQSGVDFMPHGHCFQMRPEIVLTYVASNTLIFICYMVISVAVIVHMRLKPHKDTNPLHWVFAAFIFFCVTGHAMMVINVWYGLYHLEASLLAITAVSSITTVILLALNWSKIISIPSAAQVKDLHDMALAQSEVFFDAFLMHDTVEIIYVNDAFTSLFGYTNEEVIGKFYDSLRLFPIEELVSIDKKIKEKVTGAYTTIGITKGGHHIHLAANAKEMVWKGKRVRGIAFRDITNEVNLTKRLTAYESLEDKQRAVDAIKIDIVKVIGGQSALNEQGDLDLLKNYSNKVASLEKSLSDLQTKFDELVKKSNLD